MERGFMSFALAFLALPAGSLGSDFTVLITDHSVLRADFSWN